MPVVALGALVLASLYLYYQLIRPGESKGQDEPEWRAFEPSPAFCAMDNLPLVCAHGGDSTTSTPNTKLAFFSAMQENIGCVEVDVSVSKDGTMFVLHSRELASILMQDKAKGVGSNKSDRYWEDLRHRPPRVEAFTSKELLSMRTTDGQRVLQAKDIVRLLSKDNRIEHIILDVKTHRKEKTEGEKDEDATQSGNDGGKENGEEMVGLVSELVEETQCMDKCVVWAKSDAVVEGIHAKIPGARLGMVVMNETQENRDIGLDQLNRRRLAGTSPGWVAMHYAYVSLDSLSLAHELGKQVLGWTANTDDITEHLIQQGADGIVTNYPIKVRHQLLEAKEKCP